MRHHIFRVPMQQTTHCPTLPYRTELPIFDFREKILSAIDANPVVIVTGETGCGKTTQLPLFCLEALGHNARIAVTQPRRIAAFSVAKRVAEDLGAALGSVVGFRTRFDNCSSPETRILFQTDGILLTEISRDRFFGRYDAIIIDEAHERNLNIDLIIGHLRWLLKKRHDLKVIVSSATINPEQFSKAFNNAPIVHVKGRSFPIEIVYDPFDETKMDVTRAAANAVERINKLDESGDILIFMPTERDIMAVKRKIEAMPHRISTETLPLFARLSRAHQERIFRPLGRRKIVIATNIAETSITVPGIRFVIDAGLARVKRYQPNSRITALPVERISRAGADQRAGRCGRTQEGVCIRLYSKDDYEAMECFTSAEIARSNMAGVILTMLSQRLGAIDRFAFLEPPPAKAVKDGHAHLAELGAIDGHGLLTATGRAMAAFPLDPHLARIVVAAKNQGALSEALIIAAALSCMDPRERPAEKTEAADLAHKAFGDPVSDFIWYLNVWKAYHDAWAETRSQSRMRTFCQGRFLSFTRMKEWRDVHGQLASIAGHHTLTGSGTFETIHKSLLTGFVANVAVRNDETKNYKMSHGGSAVVFPGSMLAKKGPPWVMFAEKTETSRLFLRTLAQIDPQWIAEVAPHLIRRRYSEPYFDEEAGTVRATELQIVFGLIVSKSNVAYGRINPKEAGEMFIREGLIENKLRTHYGFLAHNRAIREGVASLEAKLRVKDLYAGDAALHAWYAQRLPNITSIHDLNKIIHCNNGDSFLRLSMEDLLTAALPAQAALWPDYISIGGEVFPCTYQCDPSAPFDGMTVHLPEGARNVITDDALSWLIRPQWERRIEALFESLPRETRKRLSPLADCAAICARKLRPDHRNFYAALSQTAGEAFGVDLSESALRNAAIPAYLATHAVFDDTRLEAKRAMECWRAAVAAWEKKSIESWDFGDIPESVVIVEDKAGAPLVRFPALHTTGRSIDLVTFASADEANRFHGAGVAALVEKELEEELAWLGKNSAINREDRLRTASLGEAKALSQKAVHVVVEKFGAAPDPLCRSQRQFNAHVGKARTQLSGALRALIAVIAESGELCAAIAGRLNTLRKSPPSARLSPIVKSLILELHDYIATIASDEADHAYLSNVPRYLRRLDITIQRAMNDPLRYTARMSDMRVYEDQLRSMRDAPLSARRECRKLLEEYKISLFAQQEVKAAPGTSETKLRALFASFHV